MSKACDAHVTMNAADCIKNAAHGPETCEVAVRELEFMFPSNPPFRRNTACYDDSACAIVKPHAIRDGELHSLTVTYKLPLE